MHYYLKGRFLKTYLACLLMFTALAGCHGFQTGPSVRSPAYSWGIKNRSSMSLSYETAVTYIQDGKVITAAFGASYPGNNSTFDCGRDPIPDIVHVHWIAEELKTGVRTTHDADLPVHGHIPDEAKFTGRLYVVITDNGVKLEPESDAQRLEEDRKLGP